MKYQIQFSPCTRIPKSFKEECVLTAQYIYETVNEPIVLLLSGGIDSEIVARSFLSAKIPFTATIFSYLPNRSREDIPWAINFCEANKIQYKVIPFDIINFFKSEAFDIIHRF